MQYFRSAHHLIRLVLAVFALFLGVAIASPLVKPQAMQLVCAGAGTLKVLTDGDEGTSTSGAHTLDCPLCALGGAPLALDTTGFQRLDLSTPRVRERWSSVWPTAGNKQPPPRGPPLLS